MSRSKISALLVFALLSCGYIVQTAANSEPEGSDEAETDVKIETEDEGDDDSVTDSEYLDIAGVVVQRNEEETFFFFLHFFPFL